MENLRQLHIIRGLSALYVAIGHAKVVFWVGGQEYLAKYPRADWSITDYLVFALDMMSSAAQEFVIVFFVLSGFFIHMSFDKNKWRVKEFFANRAIRILPPYLFSILLAVGVYFFINFLDPHLFSGEIDRAINVRMTNAFNELNFDTGLLSILFLPNNDFIACNFSYWSLLPEVLFYITVPFFLRGRKLATVFFLISFIVIEFIHVKMPYYTLDRAFKFGIYFYIGILFYSWVKNHSPQEKMPPKWISYFLVISLTMLTIGLGALEIQPWSLIAASTLTMVSILTLLRYPISSKPIYRFGVFLGDISYSLYIVHLPFFYLSYTLLSMYLNDYIHFNRYYWLFIPVLLGFSYLFYRAFERPTLVWIKKLKQKRKQ